MAAQGQSSSSSLPHSWTYDVFLSFSGLDTRYNFTDHLYEALVQKGIRTYQDDFELRLGDEISEALLKAIEESRISIVVFSQNYASSKWCLNELVKIVECKKSKQQLVVPIFYKVKPEDVRHQIGSFGEAFTELCNFKDNMTKMDEWKKALFEGANLSGQPFLVGLLGYEAQLMKELVKEISVKVSNIDLDVAVHPVAIDSSVKDMHKLLDVEANDVRMVGIWGLGGIGKTTIAKAVYNSLAYKFEGSCFLVNVREQSMELEGLVQLQKTLLYVILGDKNLMFTSVDEGTNLIKKRLGRKKVLIILDDVDKQNQLHSLARESKWFGVGSRIIITTRDKHLLTNHMLANDQINLIHVVKFLDYPEARKLFCWNAFKQGESLGDYEKVITRAVNYAQGLPLALIVLGSHLCGESIDTWEDALDDYKKNPIEDIQSVLKISYKALKDSVKDVFLDIACFLKGGSKKYVIEVLKACGLNAVYGIKVLIEKSLVSIDQDYVISMHDLVQDMGKEIVYQESSTEAGRRSRLWFHEDVKHVLEENTGTDQIKGILVNFPQRVKIPSAAESFSKMKNLKLLIVRNGCLFGDIDYDLPNNLRWLDWPKYPSNSLPYNFHPYNLVAINMPRNCMIQPWVEPKRMQNLTSMVFSKSKFLKEIPDFSGIPNVKELSLDQCTSLVKVDPSVGSLDKLVKLYLHGCSHLTKFPRLNAMKSLEVLSFRGCKRLKSFPEIAGNLVSLKDIDLSGTAIKEFSCSIYDFRHLESLELDECPKLVGFTNKVNSSAESLPVVPEDLTTQVRNFLLMNSGNLSVNDFIIIHLCESGPGLLSVSIDHQNDDEMNSREGLSLEYRIEGLSISMRDSNLLKSDFLPSLAWVPRLTELDLSGSNVVSLPVRISKFVNLLKLNLSGCKRLRKILEFPPKVYYKHEAFGVVLPGNLGFNIKENTLLNQVCYKPEAFGVVLPGSDVPRWFRLIKEVNIETGENSGIDFWWPSECEVCIKIPGNFKWENGGLALCLVFEFQSSTEVHGMFKIGPMATACINEYKGVYTTSMHSPNTNSEHVWFQYVSGSEIKSQLDTEAEGPFMCRVQFGFVMGYYMHDRAIFKSFGVHLVSEEDRNAGSCGGSAVTKAVNVDEQQQQLLSLSMEPEILMRMMKKHMHESDEDQPSTSVVEPEIFLAGDEMENFSDIIITKENAGEHYSLFRTKYHTAYSYQSKYLSIQRSDDGYFVNID